MILKHRSCDSGGLAICRNSFTTVTIYLVFSYRTEILDALKQPGFVDQVYVEIVRLFWTMQSAVSVRRAASNFGQSI